MDTSLYLSQSYQDAWDDYRRSLVSDTFPVWDYIILTASDHHQASVFEQQIDSRRDFLPTRTRFAVIPDEDGVRVGSGGATLAVLRFLKEEVKSFSGRRFLVIHSGGDSRRVPQYSASGKLFSPVPHRLPDGRSSTLFDEYLIAMASVPGRIREGMVFCSGDVLLLFNALLIDYSGSGAAAVSFKEPVETGKDHGVFLRNAAGYVEQFLHKQSEAKLREAGAVNGKNAVDIDTGTVIFGTDVLDALYGLISSNGRFDSEKYFTFVNERVRLSLYGDFQYPFAEASTLEDFYRQSAETDAGQELMACRKALWDALRPFRMKLLRMAPARFLHFGTTAQVLELMTSGVEAYRDLGWEKQVNCSMNRCSGYNSVLSPEALAGSRVYLENSYVHAGAVIGDHSVLSCVEVYEGQEIPAGAVLHGLKLRNGKYVCRIYGADDNPKENRLFGKDLDASGMPLWQEGEPHSLWNARLYPECGTMKDAVDQALSLYRAWADGDKTGIGKSLADGFHDADPAAVFEWNRRMKDLVQMDRIAALIEDHADADTAVLDAPLSDIQQKWLEERTGKADFGECIRLYYYIGTALKDEKTVSRAFRELSSALLSSNRDILTLNRDAKICMQHCEVRLPLRVNWGGGWSDTPPYCNENGGTVLNAAILMNHERPVKVTVRRIEEPGIIFDSRDMDVHGEFTELRDLQQVGDPFDPFVLQKAAFLACGVFPADGGNLQELLSRLGGGIRMDTEVVGVPKGSGLGTSSILAAACVKAIFTFLGISFTDQEVYRRVLLMEQMMSTGGGWQDQVGGMTDGIKYAVSGPGPDQTIRVEHVSPDPLVKEELNGRFALIYTGQRRLARNLLRDIVGRYLGNDPDTVYALNEIQRKAALMRFELERGNVNAFAQLLNEHWELSKMIDGGCTNTLIDQIFDAVDDLLDGRMICGAGGGGFLQVIMKKGIRKEQLQERLMQVFQDTEIAVWDCELI